MISYIHNLISKNHGSISISDFMSIALYHKKYGYYINKIPIGKSRDFITSPEISQLFGEIIAVWIIYIWQKLGKPSKFSLIELGPGNGTLIYDVIRVSSKYKYFLDSVSIHLIEINPALQHIQKKKLSGLLLNINWHKDINDLPNLPTIFLANEFFDVLPIDQFIYSNNEEWYENRITKQQNNNYNSIISLINNKAQNFTFYKNNQYYTNSSIEHNQTTPTQKKNNSIIMETPFNYKLKRLNFPFFITKIPISEVQKKKSYSILELIDKIVNVKPFINAIVELCPLGIKILKQLEEKLLSNKGAGLIIDYGYIYPQYKNTIQSLKKHKYNYIFENIGNSDITSFVNFHLLKNSLNHVNSTILTQREFLYLFGIKERTELLIKKAKNHKQKNKIYNEFLRLTENMGTLFKVMIIENL